MRKQPSSKEPPSFYYYSNMPMPIYENNVCFENRKKDYYNIYMQKTIDTTGKAIASFIVTILPFSNPMSAGLTAILTYFSIVQFSKLIDNSRKSRCMEKIISYKSLVRFTLPNYGSLFSSYEPTDFNPKNNDPNIVMQKIVEDIGVGELGGAIGVFLGAAIAIYFKSNSITTFLSTSAFSFFGSRVVWAGLNATKYANVDCGGHIPSPIL